MRAGLHAAAILLVTALAACTAPTPPIIPGGVASSATAPAPSPPPVNPPPATRLAAPALPPLERLPSQTLPTPGAPGALLWAYGSVWVMAHRSTTLFRIEPDTAKVSARIDTGVYGCGDLVAGVISVWVTGCGATPGLVRISAQSNRVQATAQLTGVGPAVLDHELWICSPSDAGGEELRRADPDKLDAAKTVPVTGLGRGDGVAVAGGSIWVADATSAIVYRIDPATEAVQAAIPMPLEPNAGYLINHDGAPWYVDAATGAFVRIDPTVGSPALLKVRTAKPTQYWGLAASTAPGPAGRLWARHGDNEAWLIDTRQDRVLRRVAIANGAGGDLQEADGHLWIAHFGKDATQRITLTQQPR